jgi:preprotein translocase subunit YajC
LSDLQAGKLTASVAVNGHSNGSFVQVATVVPVIVSTTTNHLAATASSVTINGFGFTPGSTVTLSSGAVGTVTVVSANQLIVAVTGLRAGALKAAVISSGESSGTPVQVATVAPVVTSSSATTLTAKGAIAQPLIINGDGFTAGSTVTLTGATAGAVTVVSANELKVSVTNLVAGQVTAVVHSSGQSSGTPVAVATVVPAITTSVAALAPNATTLIIHGFGFSTTPGNNSVTFTSGFTGTATVIAATATTLTVKLSGTLTAGMLEAFVTTDSLYTSLTEEVADVS